LAAAFLAVASRAAAAGRVRARAAAGAPALAWEQG